MASDNKFGILLPLVLILVITFLGVVIITKLYDNNNGQWNPSRFVVSGQNQSNGKAFNVSDYMAFSTGANSRLANNTFKVIRASPDNTFTCTKVFISGRNSSQGASNTGANTIPLKLSIANGNGSLVAGAFEVICSPQGAIKFYLAGNSSNGTGGLHYNITFTAGAWDAVYNVSQNAAKGNASFTQNSGIIFLLVIFVIAIAVLGAFFGFRGGIDAGVGPEGGSGFNIGNPLDHFKR